ncbi:protein kinase [Agromyces sp. CFH 90414]|uniref:non-specific serine/threonine protein kinase n=1 Tax=Agromyces agglutinans TaxID=2662258 RepID=A0A6I2FB63_9MICO|nr:serine/threonine-protein kinase [Agromyces agglutinans]MRG59173.1 protein kinase [Agromyces agglutinans]
MTTAPERPAVDDALVGTRLGDRYDITALIGRGGMASVYRALDTALGREVAVKVFVVGEGIDDPERRRSETALLASLAHPALVTLHDAARDASTGHEFLVMELVDGPNLREHLRVQGPLGTAEAAGMLVDLAEALHAIHARGIVHRDLKPANVLLAPSVLPSRPWHAKLADFGIARLIDDSRLTAAGVLIGTPGYVSPEQVRGEGAGAASDVYALGLLALEARTGEQAFPGPGIEAASARLVHDPHVPAELGREWRELISAMTARDPADRPTALEVASRAGALPAAAAGAARDAGPATVATPATGSSSTTPSEEEATSPDATAPTKLMPAGEGNRDAGSDRRAADGRGSRSGRSDRSGRLGRWLVPALIAAVLAVAALTVLPIVIQAGGGGEPTPSPLPAVPGELGVHLEQLEEAVIP